MCYNGFCVRFKSYQTIWPHRLLFSFRIICLRIGRLRQTGRSLPRYLEFLQNTFGNWIPNILTFQVKDNTTDKTTRTEFDKNLVWTRLPSFEPYCQFTTTIDNSNIISSLQFWSFFSFFASSDRTNWAQKTIYTISKVYVLNLVTSSIVGGIIHDFIPKLCPYKKT